MKHARDSLSGVEFESPIGEIGSNNVHILRQDSLDLRKPLLGGHQGNVVSIDVFLAGGWWYFMCVEVEE